MPCKHYYNSLLQSHAWFRSHDDKSWEVGHVLFAITKPCRISQLACRSLRLMAFQLKQEQGKIDNAKHASILS